MIQLGNQRKVQAYGTLLELESRARAFDGLVSRLKDLILDQPAIIPPEIIATMDDLAWQIRKSAKLLPSLEEAMGVQRNRIRRGSSVKGAHAKDEAFRGNTRSIAITEVLSLLCAQRKTGTLWIKTDEEMFLLEFSDGAVVHAATNRPSPENRLGTILIAHNKVSKERLEDAVNGACGRPIGEAMLDAKLVSENDLRDALEHQVQELFHRVYSLEDARFAFRVGAQSDLEKRVCLSTTQLMLESARTSDERAFADADAAPELNLREDDPDSSAATLREAQGGDASAPDEPGEEPDSAEVLGNDAAGPQETEPTMPAWLDASTDALPEQSAVDEVTTPAPASEASPAAGGDDPEAWTTPGTPTAEDAQQSATLETASDEILDLTEPTAVEDGREESITTADDEEASLEDIADLIADASIDTAAALDAAAILEDDAGPDVASRDDSASLEEDSVSLEDDAGSDVASILDDSASLEDNVSLEDSASLEDDAGPDVASILDDSASLEDDAGPDVASILDDSVSLADSPSLEDDAGPDANSESDSAETSETTAEKPKRKRRSRKKKSGSR